MLTGFRGGLLAGFLSLPVNALLLNLAGWRGWTRSSGGEAGWGSFILINLGAGVGRLRDLGEKVEQQARELERRVSRNPLTDLHNRALFVEHLERALFRADQDPGNVAVLLLDLDDFKDVNDSLGHEMGDRLPVAAAGRIRGCFAAGDTVAQLSGDELAILPEDIDDLENTERVAQRILRRLGEPFEIDGRVASVTASIGSVLGSTPDDRPDALLNQADLPMYRAKVKGKARYEASEG